MKFCQKCGTEHDDVAVSCTNCGASFEDQTSALAEKPKKKKKKGRKLLIILLVLVVAFFALMMSGDDTPSVTVNENGDVVQGETVISQADFKKSCVEVAYEDLARNPENYKDQNLKFKGEVIQCDQEYGTSYYARVNVTVDEYDFYTDTIYVTFEIPEGADKILEDDIVELYGICQGSETYTSIFGEQITIPSLDALYVELVK